MNALSMIINGKEILNLTETQLKILAHDIHADELLADLERRAHYIISHKLEQCGKRLKEQYVPELEKAGHDMIPTKIEHLAELIFSLPHYKDRKAREADAQLGE